MADPITHQGNVEFALLANSDALPDVDLPTFVMVDPRPSNASLDPHATNAALDPRNTQVAIDQ